MMMPRQKMGHPVQDSEIASALNHSRRLALQMQCPSQNLHITTSQTYRGIVMSHERQMLDNLYACCLMGCWILYSRRSRILSGISQKRWGKPFDRFPRRFRGSIPSLFPCYQCIYHHRVSSFPLSYLHCCKIWPLYTLRCSYRYISSFELYMFSNLRRVEK